MYGEDSLCFPDAKQEIDHIKFAPYTKRLKKTKGQTGSQLTINKSAVSVQVECRV